MASVNKPFNVGPLICQFVSVTFQDANTDVPVPHSLGIIPQAVLVVSKDRSCDIWDSERPRSRAAVQLQCNTAGINAVVLVAGFTVS